MDPNVYIKCRKRKIGHEELRMLKDWNDQIVVGADGFGENDFISRQPDLCLFKVFKNLPRKDIYNMSFVSKKMRTMANDESLDTIKWPHGHLEIYQITNGYGFYLHNGSAPKNTPESTFQYMCCIKNGELLEWRDSKSVSRGRPGKSRRRHGIPVPDELFTALSELIRDKEVERLTITNLHIEDGELFGRLASILKDHKTRFIQFNGVKCPAITDDIRDSFISLISSTETVGLRYSDEIVCLINEEFIRRLGKSKVRGIGIIYSDIGVDSPITQNHSFPVTKSSLFSLLRFKSFNLASMVVNVNWVTEFIMAFMGARVDDPWIFDRWSFAIDQPLTETIIVRDIRAADFEYEKTDFGHKITQISDGMEATLESLRYDRNGRQLHLLYVDLKKE